MDRDKRGVGPRAALERRYRPGNDELARVGARRGRWGMDRRKTQRIDEPGQSQRQVRRSGVALAAFIALSERGDGDYT